MGSTLNPSTKPSALMQNLTLGRCTKCKVFRTLLGHAGFGAYFGRIPGRDPMCPFCHVLETRAHLLLSCPNTLPTCHAVWKTPLPSTESQWFSKDGLPILASFLDSHPAFKAEPILVFDPGGPTVVHVSDLGFAIGN